MVLPKMPNEDLDFLLEILVSFARELLQQNELRPFAAVLSPRGGCQGVVPDDLSAGSDPEEIVAALTETLRRQALAGELIAAGLCVDVLVQSPGVGGGLDAIEVRLEHFAGESLSVFLPYRGGIDGQCEYGDPFCQDAAPCVFPRPASSSLN